MDRKNLEVRDLHLERKKMWDGSMASHGKYLDQNTNLFDTKFTEDRSCPTCDSIDQKKLFNKSGGTYVRCQSCEMVYLNPVFTDKNLEEYYRNNHNIQSQVVAQDFGFYRDLYIQGLLSFENFYSSKNERSILDVGCSAGGFLNIAKERGWKTYGLEFNRQEAVVCRKAGHDVFEEDLGKFVKSTKLTFNIITLWDVFEHIKNGGKFLEQAKSILKSGGGVFIQSPTPNALAARVLQEKCNMFDGLEHVNLYTHENIKQIAKKTGFTVVSYSTVISEKGVLNNYLDYQDPYLGQTKNIISPLIASDDFILGNKLGYKYQIFLKMNE